MKRTNTKEAQKIIREKIKFYFSSKEELKKTMPYYQQDPNEPTYKTIKCMVYSLQFGIDEFEIDMLINALKKNNIKIGKDNIKDLDSKWKWYANLIAINAKKMLEDNNSDNNSNNKSKLVKKKEVSPNYKLARFVKQMGYRTIANEIAQDKRPIQNIDFLLNEFIGRPENDRKFLENDIHKATVIATLEKYKKILKPNDPKILKYIALERKKQNAHFRVAQLYEKIEGATGEDFDKWERTIDEAQDKYDKLEAQMFKFIKENIK